MHSIAVSLHPSIAEDAENLASIRVIAMRDSLEHVGRFDADRARQRFLSTFVPEFTRHIVTEEGRVGFVVVREQENELLLDHLYIHPDHQGKSIGATVLDFIFVEADEMKINLRVGALRGSKSNEFYLRHGFRLVQQAEWDNYYVRPPKSAA